ncbi:hypothetical protein SRIMM317S_03070 [Streptomyces rimosus subsp. rimosus]
MPLGEAHQARYSHRTGERRRRPESARDCGEDRQADGIAEEADERAGQEGAEQRQPVQARARDGDGGERGTFRSLCAAR